MLDTDNTLLVQHTIYDFDVLEHTLFFNSLEEKNEHVLSKNIQDFHNFSSTDSSDFLSTKRLTPLLNTYIFTGSPLYLLRYSPWPFILSFILLHTCIIIVGFFDTIFYPTDYLCYTVLILITTVVKWLFDLSLESLKGVHNSVLRCSFTLGFLLFILSEIMFFFSLF